MSDMSKLTKTQRKLLITEVTNLLAFHEVYIEPEMIKKLERA